LVAYFGPHPSHARALETVAGLKLLRLDYFAEGYVYDRRTIRADVQAIPLQDRAVDGVIILHVLEHVRNFSRALAELRRVVRPGGFVEHDTPCWLQNDPDYAEIGSTKTGKAKRDVPCGTTARKDRICSQQDHKWAYRCEHLRNRFEARGFKCTTPGAQISFENYTRFMSMSNATLDRIMYDNIARRGRFRCERLPKRAYTSG